MSVYPTSILLGSDATVTWQSSGVTACTASGPWSGAKSPNGQEIVTPSAAAVFTYALSCTTASGSISGSTTLTVSVSPVVTLTVLPQRLLAGQSATLSWSSTAATICSASGAWAGTQATNGQATTSPVFPGDYSYALSCENSMGFAAGVTTNLTVAPNGFSRTQLVANISGPAHDSDPSLLNPWGIVFPTEHAAVVANNQGNTSTSYDGSGAAQSPNTGTSPLAVQLPAGDGGVPFNPTGVVAAPAGITVTAAGKSGPAQLIYAGEGGMIAAWAPTVDAATAVTVYTDSGGAVYKSLVVGGNYLYAADFHNNKIDVFDSTFAKQAGYPFIDPTLPAGYAPHGLLVDGSSLYVAYAMQLAPANRDAALGAGLGIVDEFDLKGNFSKRFTAGGALNAPWGMTIASTPFCLVSKQYTSCSFAGALLVANTGDGKINGFDPTSGASVGALIDASGTPLAITGLHGIAVGNRYANQPDFTLFYTAGGNNAGLFGRIDFGAAPRLHEPPSLSVAVSAPNPENTCYVSANATSAVGIAWIDFFDVLPSGSFSIRADAAGQIVYPLGYAGSIDTYPWGCNGGSATVTDVDGNIATSSTPP